MAAGLGTLAVALVATAAPAAAVGCAQTFPSWGYGQACGSVYNDRLQIAVDDRATDGHCVTATTGGRGFLTSCGAAVATTLMPGTDLHNRAYAWGVRIQRGGSYSTVCDGYNARVAGKPACSDL